MLLDPVPLGDTALRLRVPPGVDRRALLAGLRALPGVLDAWLTEDFAAVRFDTPPDLGALRLDGVAVAPPRDWEVRARYDGADLARVAAWAGLAPEEVARLHAGRVYEVRYLGFSPGFAYLAEVDARIAAPRLAVPRPRVPAGSVGVAGARTGVYPREGPGGWNLVATALDPLPPWEPGDRVRFVPCG
ncbi:MAG: 5-oxoprolinase subunit B family protein [Myxococcota bacterium]